MSFWIRSWSNITWNKFRPRKWAVTDQNGILLLFTLKLRNNGAYDLYIFDKRWLFGCWTATTHNKHFKITTRGYITRNERAIGQVLVTCMYAIIIKITVLWLGYRRWHQLVIICTYDWFENYSLDNNNKKTHDTTHKRTNRLMIDVPHHNHHCTYIPHCTDIHYHLDSHLCIAAQGQTSGL